MLIFLQYFRLRTEKLSNKSQDGDSGAFDQTFALITWSVDSRWGKEAATAHGATHSNSQTATVVSGVVDSACLATQSTCAHTSTPCHACHKMLNKLNVLFFRCVTCSAPLPPPSYCSSSFGSFGCIYSLYKCPIEFCMSNVHCQLRNLFIKRLSPISTSSFLQWQLHAAETTPPAAAAATSWDGAQCMRYLAQAATTSVVHSSRRRG